MILFLKLYAVKALFRYLLLPLLCQKFGFATVLFWINCLPQLTILDRKLSDSCSHWTKHQLLLSFKIAAVGQTNLRKLLGRTKQALSVLKLQKAEKTQTSRVSFNILILIENYWWCLLISEPVMMSHLLLLTLLPWGLGWNSGVG